ncbi:MAG: VOC family protein [Brevibacterium sp.]|nr:VOC family protein [Brevibacterium sp.]
MFPNSRIVSIERCPEASVEPPCAGMSGKGISGVFDLDGNRFICLDADPGFTFNEAISVTVECATQTEIDHYWSSLMSVPAAKSAAGSRTDMGSAGRSCRPTSASRRPGMLSSRR